MGKRRRHLRPAQIGPDPTPLTQTWYRVQIEKGNQADFADKDQALAAYEATVTRFPDNVRLVLLEVTAKVIRERGI